MVSYEKKLREFFYEESVRKNPKYTDMFKDFGLPSYMRDWLVKKFSDEDGNIDPYLIKRRISNLIITRGDTETLKWLKHHLNEGKDITFLTEIEVDIDLRTGKYHFKLPLLNFPEGNMGIIDEQLVEKYSKYLLTDRTWGTVKLRLIEDEDGRYVYCYHFKPFKPYNVDLDYYIQARNEFTTEEWIDVIISAMDYNPQFLNFEEKLWMITRLFPFVERNFNLIELAPKGTGKSYVYSKLSKYGWMISGGVVTRAKFFYDMKKRSDGIVSKYDYVVLDEIQSVRLKDPQELVGVLKDYLESGEYRIGDHKGSGEAGFVILGNIPKDYMDVSRSFLKFLPEHFRETAFLDRFHAFIEGWKIPRMRENLKADGWALNTEYFSEILHKLRYEVSYGRIVREILEHPHGADTRDTKAVRKNLTACMKILFPHIDSARHEALVEFKNICLEHSVKLRQNIRYQMSLVDKEYTMKLPKYGLKIV